MRLRNRGWLERFVGCMAEERNPQRRQKRQHISAEDARGGEIILRTKTMRLIFIVGLAGLVIIGLILRFGG